MGRPEDSFYRIRRTASSPSPHLQRARYEAGIMIPCGTSETFLSWDSPESCPSSDILATVAFPRRVAESHRTVDATPRSLAVLVVLRHLDGLRSVSSKRIAAWCRTWGSLCFHRAVRSLPKKSWTWSVSPTALSYPSKASPRRQPYRITAAVPFLPFVAPLAGSRHSAGVATGAVITALVWAVLSLDRSSRSFLGPNWVAPVRTFVFGPLPLSVVLRLRSAPRSAPPDRRCRVAPASIRDVRPFVSNLRRTGGWPAGPLAACAVRTSLRSFISVELKVAVVCRRCRRPKPLARLQPIRRSSALPTPESEDPGSRDGFSAPRRAPQVHAAIASEPHDRSRHPKMTRPADFKVFLHRRVRCVVGTVAGTTTLHPSMGLVPLRSLSLLLVPAVSRRSDPESGPMEPSPEGLDTMAGIRLSRSEGHVRRRSAVRRLPWGF